MIILDRHSKKTRKGISHWVSPGTIYRSRDILQAVSDYFHLPLPVLISSSRRHELVYPRQIASYLMREKTHPQMSSYEIATILKKSDSTIRYSYRDIRAKLSIEDKQVCRDINNILVDHMGTSGIYFLHTNARIPSQGPDDMD